MSANASLELQHTQWLEQGVTKLVSRIIDAHRESLVKAIANESSQVTEESDRKLRQLAVQLKTVDTLKLLIYDTNILIANSERASSH